MTLYEEKIICGKLDQWFEVAKVKLSSLPNNYHCKGSLSCDGSLLKELPSNMIIEGNLYIGECEITQLPQKLIIGGDLILLNSSIFDLPEDICICGNIIAIKVNNPPKYIPNTIYENFICDKDGNIIPFYSKKYIPRTLPEPNHRMKSYTFYKGIFDKDIIVYDDPPRIIPCNGLRDGLFKIDRDSLKNSPFFKKYYDYDINQKRFVKELITIFRDITDACDNGIEEYLKSDQIVMTNKYSIVELDEMLKKKVFSKTYYTTTYVALFDDYFFHREKFE